MYLVSNVMEDVCSDIQQHVMNMFYLNKAHKFYNWPEDCANENLSDLVDIMNQACALSIYDEIADYGSGCVVSHLPEIVERDLMNNFSGSSIDRIVKKFEEGIFWQGDAIASLDVVSDIQRKKYRAPAILELCIEFLGYEIGHIWKTKDSWIREIKTNENVDWSRPKWKKFIQVLRKMSWKKLCKEGRGILKIVEHLDEYKEGGREDDWGALYVRIPFKHEGLRIVYKSHSVDL